MFKLLDLNHLKYYDDKIKDWIKKLLDNKASKEDVQDVNNRTKQLENDNIIIKNNFTLENQGWYRIAEIDFDIYDDLIPLNYISNMIIYISRGSVTTYPESIQISLLDGFEEGNTQFKLIQSKGNKNHHYFTKIRLFSQRVGNKEKRSLEIYNNTNNGESYKCVFISMNSNTPNGWKALSKPIKIEESGDFTIRDTYDISINSYGEANELVGEQVKLTTVGDLRNKMDDIAKGASNSKSQRGLRFFKNSYKWVDTWNNGHTYEELKESFAWTYYLLNNSNDASYSSWLVSSYTADELYFVVKDNGKWKEAQKIVMTISNATGENAHAEGLYTEANGEFSHSEGMSTIANGDGSHAENVGNVAEGSASHAEGVNTTALGAFSHSEGSSTLANQDYSHAEGSETTANGQCSHTEGLATSTSGNYSHAEGYATSVIGDNSHAEGTHTYVSGERAHAEGGYTTASGASSHTEGYVTLASNVNTHAEGYATVASGEHAHSEGFWAKATGNKSHAEGASSTANGEASHAEGMFTNASNLNSHAEGGYTTASGQRAHSEGDYTYAYGNNSHAEGSNTTAYGNNSHVEGYFSYAADTAHAEGLYTSATGLYAHTDGERTVGSTYSAHASGCRTTASNANSYSMGHYNTAMTTGGTAVNTTGTALVIGNGTSATALRNAFSIMFDGTVKASSTITGNVTADYAEFFEWADKNKNNEDRVGHFVTFDENDSNKIRIAREEDDFILGIVSGEPFVLGNADCDVWTGMVVRDNFNRVIYEPAPLMKVDEETGEYVPVLDKEGNQIYQGKRPIINPEYDSSQEYINRSERPEWDAIGMLGVLSVWDDGTCVPGKYCKVANGGIATYCDKRNFDTYRVLERVTDNIVKVVFK